MRITGQEQVIRKDRMLHTAYSLFCEFGIDHVSLARIAEAAGVSPNSIFRYFDSKAVLLQQTQEILWKEIVGIITAGNQPSVNEAENGLEEVRIMLGGFGNLYRNYSNYVLFSYEYKAYMLRNNIRTRYDELEDNISCLKDLFVLSLERGKMDGSVSAKNTSSEQFLFIWGVMRNFVEQMVVHGRIYEGATPWNDMFPIITENIIECLQYK